MLFDTYLLPICELALSIFGPLVLTLKAIHVSTVLPSGDANRTNKILTFWLNYWFLMFFIHLIGVNNHFSCAFSIIYIAQKDSIFIQLLKFYQLTVLPFTSQLVLRVFNTRLTEAEVDLCLDRLLNKVCFDSTFLEKTFSLFSNRSVNGELGSNIFENRSSNVATLPFGVTSRSDSDFASNRDSFVDTSIDNMIPLEFRKEKGRIRSTSVSKSLQPNENPSVSKKSSKQNMKSRSVSTESTNQQLYTSNSNSNMGHPSRVSSGDFIHSNDATTEDSFVNFGMTTSTSISKNGASTSSSDTIFQDSKKDKKGLRGFFI